MIYIKTYEDIQLEQSKKKNRYLAILLILFVVVLLTASTYIGSIVLPMVWYNWFCYVYKVDWIYFFCYNLSGDIYGFWKGY